MAFLLPYAAIGLGAGLSAYGSSQGAKSTAKSTERLAAQQYQQYQDYLSRLNSLSTPGTMGQYQNDLFRQFMASPAYSAMNSALTGASNRISSGLYGQLGSVGGFNTGIGQFQRSLAPGIYGNALAGQIGNYYQSLQDPALRLLLSRLGPPPPQMGGYTGPSGGSMMASQLGQGLLGFAGDYLNAQWKKG